jgi:hypothetical protein
MWMSTPCDQDMDDKSGWKLDEEELRDSSSKRRIAKEGEEREKERMQVQAEDADEG